MNSILTFKIIIFLSALLIGLPVQRARAGIGLKPLDFFRLGEEDLGKEIKVIFHPEEGLRLRENFEKKYGVKGEELIRSLGEGNAPSGRQEKNSVRTAADEPPWLRLTMARGKGNPQTPRE